MRIAIFGLSITSSWGNGHATTYRALVKALAARGHQVVFLERDVPWYAESRDLPVPPFCETHLYREVREAQARFGALVAGADLVIVGSFVPEGERIGRWVTAAAGGATAFYDIDTPVTVARLRAGRDDYLSRALVPRYDLYLSFTGGRVLELLADEFRARRPRPLYCAVDPDLYAPEAGARQWDLGFMGTYAPDRQAKLDDLLLGPARALPDRRFAVVGPMYPDDLVWPANVARRDHLAPGAHRRFYNGQRFTLNLTRDAMAESGWSPAVRLFEAAACGTAVITDDWHGLDLFFEPGREIIVARTGQDVVERLEDMSEEESAAIGRAARARVLREHTAAHRAKELERHVREAQGADMFPGAALPEAGRV